MGSAIETKLICETRGLAPRINNKSDSLISGIGWIVLEPNIASEAANLLAQSWVPEPKFRLQPMALTNEPMAGPAVELKASGLPVYTAIDWSPCSACNARIW